MSRRTDWLWELARARVSFTIRSVGEALETSATYSLDYSAMASAGPLHNEGPTHLACSFHRNRGPYVCANGRVVRREELERGLLAEIQKEILSTESIAYLRSQVF